MATKGGALTFCDEQWTAEVTRLLLEVDEGWVGFHGDAAWSWRDETYEVFAAVCRERHWPCNSQVACVAMLQALRTGAIRMHLSSSTRTSDGCAQWTLDEMRELGAQMKRVTDGKRTTMHWTAQFVAFMEAMKTKDATYRIAGRMVDDFAARAGKYVPEVILTLIQNGSSTMFKTVATTTRTRLPTPKPEKRSRRVTRGQKAMEEAEASGMDNDDVPLFPKGGMRELMLHAGTRRREDVELEVKSLMEIPRIMTRRRTRRWITGNTIRLLAWMLRRNKNTANFSSLKCPILYMYTCLSKLSRQIRPFYHPPTHFTQVQPDLLFCLQQTLDLAARTAQGQQNLTFEPAHGATKSHS